MGPPNTPVIEIPLRLLGYTQKDRSPLWGLHLGDRSALTHTAVLFILRTSWAKPPLCVTWQEWDSLGA